MNAVPPDDIDSNRIVPRSAVTIPLVIANPNPNPPVAFRAFVVQTGSNRRV